MNYKERKKMRIMFWIEVIVVVLMIIIGANETGKFINEIKSYKPDVVYEMSNKSIKWK